MLEEETKELLLIEEELDFSLLDEIEELISLLEDKTLLSLDEKALDELSSLLVSTKEDWDSSFKDELNSLFWFDELWTNLKLQPVTASVDKHKMLSNNFFFINKNPDSTFYKNKWNNTTWLTFFKM